MISVTEIKNGMTIISGGEIYLVLWFQHVKPGKGGAFVKTRLRNVKSNSVLEKTFRSGESVEQAFLDKKVMEYLYKDGNSLWFMDAETYEQIPLSADMIGDGIRFLKENAKIEINFYEGKIIGVELPLSVELKVAETEPGFKGNTVAGASKNVVLETGAVIKAPLFIKEGDILKIDTRTGVYIQRV